MKNGKEKIKKLLKIIKKDYPVETFFIISNLINGLIIRIVTVKNGLFISPLLVDLGFNKKRKTYKIFYYTINNI